VSFTLDPKQSRIRIRTFAEGLFSRLAHDLELICRDVAGAASDDRSCNLTIPVRAIDVVGTLKHGKVDTGALSPSDREDILGKMRREVFHGADAITIEASVERVKVISPKGKTLEKAVSLKPEKRDDGSLRVEGQLDISLNAIGSDPVKGPMNAFRVKDVVEVHFDLVFQPA
jgi:hypothetical protein